MSELHTKKIILRNIATVLMAILVLGDTVNGAQQESGLGSVNFQVSCSTAVSGDFDRAVALLHHMQYVEARAAFERITQTQPSCAMAHWGIAMTLFQPLWPSRPGPDALQRGWEEVKRAIDLGGGSPRETDLLVAAEAFFREPQSAQWWDRIQRWSAAMKSAYMKRPEDIETAALYALSQLSAGQVGPDRMVYHERAAEVLLGIYDREPRHPGAIHYTIHANDVDSRAERSLGVVRSYKDIAPEVPHALHMPTHIFVRLGEWAEVIEWNRRSADAALHFPAGKAISHHYPHALDYLVYAHLQRGDDDQAQATMQEILNREGPFQGSFMSAFHLAAIPARYAVERRMWDEAKSIKPGTPESLDWDRFWWAESMSWFARGLGAVRSGELTEATYANKRMTELRDAATSAGEEGFATYIEVDRLVLIAWQARISGEDEKALERVREAVRLQGKIQKHPVTPGALYPAQEALGDLLLDQQRPRDALSAYEEALETWPNRFNSIVGAARAARDAGLKGEAQSHYRKLVEISSPESERPELAEARLFLGE